MMCPLLIPALGRFPGGLVRRVRATSAAALLLAAPLVLCVPTHAAAQSLRYLNYTTANGLGCNTVLGVFVGGSTVYTATASNMGISTDGGIRYVNRTWGASS